MDSNDIFVKEEAYRTQMAGIRETVLRFAESKCWRPMSRGRRAHVSIYGQVNNLDGHVDIIMQEDDWTKMPKLLQSDTPFDLYCSAGINVGGAPRQYADTELFWRCPFTLLAETVDRFLPIAWDMLSKLTATNLIHNWPGPPENPDFPPCFGPPRKVPKQS